MHGLPVARVTLARAGPKKLTLRGERHPGSVMGLEIRQNLKLQQSLVMTPQIQQAIKLLQLSHLELADQIQQEILENPTLEEVPGSVTVENDQGEQAMATQAQSEQKDEAERTNSSDNEFDWATVLEGHGDRSYEQRGSAGTEELPPIETNLVSASNLAQHLEWQLQMTSCTDGERVAAEVIIRSLDDRGWLTVGLDELITEYQMDREEAEGALLIVQQFDPLGCGARDLVECLDIQIKTLFPEDPHFPLLVRSHLDDIQKRNYPAIARAMGLDLEDVIEYHRMLRQLEPWPGRRFSSEDPQYISPDVYVVRVGDEWQVRQNEDGLPKLRISNYYKNVLTGKDSTREERNYIKERLASADFLIRSIYKRQDTIGKVVRCILRRQADFFERGPDHLRPMVLRDVADEVGLHESTVSRVTSNKYLQCPHGLFELKYFFNNGLNAVHGEQVAAEAVKRRIKRLIASEPTDKPLSDDAIVQVLQKENVEIARRTVAKYREAMGILPSSKRRNPS